MRVLYFHQHFSTRSGSVGIRSYEMALRLIARGHHVTMVCGSFDGGKTGLTQPFVKGRRRGIVDGINVIEFDLPYSNSEGFVRRSFSFFNYALKGIVIAFSEKYDLVFSTSTPLTVAIPGIFSRWLKSKPFVLEVRDLWPELPRAMGVIRNPIVLGLMSFLEWVSYRSAHRFIGLSPGVVDGIKRLGVPDSRVTLIPNGCDFSIFGNVSKPWRPKGVDGSDLMAIFAGTHGPANGLDAVLNAAHELQRRKREDIKIVLIGRGKLKDTLKRKASKLNLTNVIFHDPVDKNRLAGLMQSADLGLQILTNVPAFYTGTSPNKFFDYISAGLPVLTNYPGWVADMISANQCGFAIEPNNPSKFADVMEVASNDRNYLKTMGTSSSSLARREFDRDLLGRHFVNWLESANEQ